MGFVVTAKHVDYNGACALNTALFFISFPFLAWTVFRHVTDTTAQSHFGKLGPTVENPTEISSMDNEKAITQTRVATVNPAAG